MYICNKCGKETFNSDMICDECKEIGKPKIQEKEKETKTVTYQNKEEKQENKVKTEEKNSTINTNLMYCPDCGKVISRNALSCPNCGCVIRKEEPKRIVKRNGAVRFFCYLTSVIGFFILGAIPCLIWGIIFALYCSGVDETKYDIDYYKSLRKECFIAALVIFIINLLFLPYIGKFSVIF